MRCLTSSRFTMWADILKPGDATPDDWSPDDYGHWIKSQDPLTGQIVNVWEPYPDDPTTTGPSQNENLKYGTIRCLARGIVDGGIRVAGTTERFGDTYENIDFAKMWVPAGTRLTKRDRITNIRNQKKLAGSHIFWADEENVDENFPLKATTFNVNGITPLFDAFNRNVEQFVLLERAPDAEAVTT